MTTRNRGRRGGDWETVSGYWGDGNALEVAALLTPAQSPILSIPAAVPAAGVVPIGRAIISEIDIMIDIVATSGAGNFVFCAGLFIAQANIAGTLSTQDPALPADVCRDNWLDLWVKGLSIPAAPTTVVSVSHVIKLRRPITLSKGYGLAFAWNLAIGPLASTLSFFVNARYKVTRIV
jgi:hypothetical protein